MNPHRPLRVSLSLITTALLLLAVGGVVAAEDFSPFGFQVPAGRPSSALVFLPLVMNNFDPSHPGPTATPPPAAPSGLGGQNIAQGWIRLSWMDNSHSASSFVVEQNIAGGFSQVKSVSGSVPSADIQGLAPATGYSFRVYACNAAGCSGYSNTATITTLEALPASPSNLVATALCSTRIQLSWSDNSYDETQFRIEQAPPYWMLAQVVPANSTSTIIASGLAASTVYSYHIRSENSGGNSAYSDVISATTQAAPFSNEPCAPSSLIATPLSSSSVRLDWIDNASNESGFEIEQSTDGNVFSLVQSPGPNTTSASISGLAAGTVFYFRVRAKTVFLGTHYSPYSNTVTVRSLSAGAPVAPSNLSGTASSSASIVLNWQDNSDNETGFVVEEQIGSGSFTGLPALAANTTTLTRASLSPNTTYTYHVRAVNGSGNSSWSNLATVTTPGNPQSGVSLPLAPANLTTEVTSTTDIQLWWDNPESNNDDGVEIEHSTDGVNFSTANGYGQFAGHHLVGSLDGNLDPVSIHFYRVRTYNAAGHSAWSNIAYDVTWGTTAPAAPTGLVATPVSSSVIHLKYNHSMANVEGFLYSYSLDNANWSDDFGGLRTLEVDITNLNAGQQYWFRVRAYNRDGNLSNWNCATNPMHCSPPSATATATTAGGGGNSTRFMNDSSYPIISLKIDGLEKFIAPNAIPVGGYYEVTNLAPGISHNIQWANGFWQGTLPFTMYQGSSAFVPPTGTATFTIPNPSIGQLLTHLQSPGAEAYWVGQAWQGGTIGSRGFCFRNDSNEPNSLSHWWFYRDGVFDGSAGTVGLVSYPKPGTFNITFSVSPGSDFQGALDESAGLADFYMHNGPTDWRWVDYYHTSGPCPSHP